MAGAAGGLLPLGFGEDCPSYSGQGGPGLVIEGTEFRIPVKTEITIKIYNTKKMQ